MKIAKVIPLFKSGSKNYFNNYKPISLLPQLSKILEKLYSNRLNIFTKTCDILNPCQYGFWGEMSTTHALVKVVSEITNSLNKRKHSIGVFIDLQKAFDTVDHPSTVMYETRIIWYSRSCLPMDKELFIKQNAIR